jgi:hypothetical protein
MTSFEIARTDERLRIVQKASLWGSLILFAIIAAPLAGLGIALPYWSLAHTDFVPPEAHGNLTHAELQMVRDELQAMQLMHRIAALTFYGIATLTTLGLLALLVAVTRRTEIVLDTAKRTLQLASVWPFGVAIRREIALASVCNARVAGSRGDFWQFEFVLDRGDPVAPISMRTNAYQPEELLRIADQVNEFLPGSRPKAASLLQPP